MAPPLNWHLDILPADQRALWEHKLQAGFPGWVLYGDTALALRLGHRTSVDFDFFSAEPLVPLEFRTEHALDGDILQAEANTLSVLHRGVKLSFFGGLSLGVLHAPDLLGRCPVASLDDLGAGKLAALVNRVELKDYLDVSRPAASRERPGSSAGRRQRRLPWRVPRRRLPQEPHLV